MKYARFFMFNTKEESAFRGAVPDGRRRVRLLQQRQRLPQGPHHRRVHHQAHAAAPAHHLGLRSGIAGQELHGAQESRIPRPEQQQLPEGSRRDQPDELPEAPDAEHGRQHAQEHL
ncbi:MAG: hypothetical protein ACLRSE_05225 [Alistipes finegoldii]